MNRYTCSRGHESVRYRTNYITKIAECAKHHCNHPIVKYQTPSGTLYVEEGAKNLGIKILNYTPMFLDLKALQ